MERIQGTLRLIPEHPYSVRACILAPSPSTLKIHAGGLYLLVTGFVVHLCRYALRCVCTWSPVPPGGQAPNLNWVELADTVYGVRNAQDTFVIYIQTRSGNVRRFERYSSRENSWYVSDYDSVFLDASGRVTRIRSYTRSAPDQPFRLLIEYNYTYPGSPTIKLEIATNPPNVVAEAFAYGLTTFEGSALWDLGIIGRNVPTEVYPSLYLTAQYGDSVLLRSLDDDEALAIARRARPGACDTLVAYAGTVNNPTDDEFGRKLCHTNGRIDSIISEDDATYWSYDLSGRPVREIYIGFGSLDTTLYSYDVAGRLIETRCLASLTNSPMLGGIF